MNSDFRHYLRRFIPRDIYQRLGNAANSLALIRKEGPAAWSALRPLDNTEQTVRFKSLRHPFTFRRNASHVNGILQNIMREEYDSVPFPGNPRVILDAGAYIGDLTCHWATRYPDSRIIALEPSPENRHFAALNTAPYGSQVVLLPQGLWSRPARLGLEGAEMGSHLTDVSPDSAKYVEAIDIPSLMRDHHIDQIDLLKLDIEGAEQEVLGESCLPWLPSVRMAVVEMHGLEIEADIVQRMQKHGFTASRRRSLIFFTR